MLRKSLFKNQSSASRVPWRDENGEIVCPGIQYCSDECSDRCPISLQTNAHLAGEMGNFDEAVKGFKKALSIAPDFKQCWNNLAATYGQHGNYIEAYKAYLAAYNIDPYYKNALFGLIISSRDMGRFDESMKYCDELENCGDIITAEQLREQVLEKKAKNETKEQKIDLEIAKELVNTSIILGLIDGLAKDKFSYIPELLVERETVCGKILKDLLADSDPCGKNPKCWTTWGAYAGIGAVWHWHHNWGALKEKGIAETLLEPRGSFAMDEYVHECIGVEFESSEGQKLSKEIWELGLYALIQFVDIEKQSMPSALEAMKGMYLWGMVYEMNKLGMR